MIISLLFIIPSKVGGAENYIYNLIDAFNNKKLLKFTLLVDFDYYDFYRERFPNNKIVTHKIFFHRRLDELLIFFLNREIKNYNLYFSPNYITPILPFYCKTKIFTTIHDIQFKFFPEYFNFLKKIWLEYNIKRTLKNSYQTILISNTVLNEIDKFYTILKNKIKVVHNSVNLKKRGNVKIEKSILSVTAHYPHKNINILIKSFKRRRDIFKDYKLIIVGQLSDKLVSTNHSEYDFDKNIEIKGYVDNEELELLFSSASLYFTTTLYEGFCMPVVESLINGVPVLCSDLKILREVSNDKASFIKNPLDIKCVTDELNNCLDSISILKLKSESNMKYFKQKYSTNEIASKYAEIFKL